MSTFEYCYTWIEQNFEKDSWYRSELGLGVRPIIPISGFIAALTRGFVESTFISHRKTLLPILFFLCL
jgi:hypothetical protein